jgi:hypothetical protein
MRGARGTSTSEGGALHALKFNALLQIQTASRMECAPEYRPNEQSLRVITLYHVLSRSMTLPEAAPGELRSIRVDLQLGSGPQDYPFAVPGMIPCTRKVPARDLNWNAVQYRGCNRRANVRESTRAAGLGKEDESQAVFWLQDTISDLGPQLR